MTFTAASLRGLIDGANELHCRYAKAALLRFSPAPNLALQAEFRQYLTESGGGTWRFRNLFFGTARHWRLQPDLCAQVHGEFSLCYLRICASALNPCAAAVPLGCSFGLGMDHGPAGGRSLVDCICELLAEAELMYDGAALSKQSWAPKNSPVAAKQGKKNKKRDLATKGRVMGFENGGGSVVEYADDGVLPC